MTEASGSHTRRWLTRRRMLILLGVVLAAAGVIAVYYSAVGVPTTPMTAARADRMFKEALTPGMRWEEVKSWLASRGIPPDSPSTPEPSYSILRRHEDVTFKGWWMDCVGHQTVAERAGLRIDDVFWLVRVSYPDADWGLFSKTEIRVYLFFDDNDRLLKSWVEEFNWGL